VTGVEWISCLFVDDKDMPLTMRLKKSPWYRLERTTTWVTDPSLWHNNTGTGTDKRTWSYKSAWSKATQHSFSVTTSIEVQAGCDFIGGSIKASTSFSTAFAETLSITCEEDESFEMEIPSGTAKALFRREETLSLKRMDGKKVPGAEWKTYGGTATATYPS